MFEIRKNDTIAATAKLLDLINGTDDIIHYLDAQKEKEAAE